VLNHLRSDMWIDLSLKNINRACIKKLQAPSQGSTLVQRGIQHNMPGATPGIMKNEGENSTNPPEIWRECDFPVRNAPVSFSEIVVHVYHINMHEKG